MDRKDKQKILQGVLSNNVRVKSLSPAKYGILQPTNRLSRPVYLIDGRGVGVDEFFHRVLNDESVNIITDGPEK